LENLQIASGKNFTAAEISLENYSLQIERSNRSAVFIFVLFKNQNMFSKFILLLNTAYLFSSMAAKAQFKKGDRFAGVNYAMLVADNITTKVSFPSPTEGYTIREQNTSGTFTPLVGYFISGRTAVGGGVSFTDIGLNTRYKAANGNTFREDNDNRSDIGFTVFVRSYLKSNSPGGFQFFGQANLGAGYSWRKIDGFVFGSNYKETYEGKSSGGFYFLPSLAIGFTRMVSTHVGMEVLAGFQYRQSNYGMKTITLRDDGIDGTIDATAIGDATFQQKKYSVNVGAGFFILIDRSK
jgi:hypothetical protein